MGQGEPPPWGLAGEMLWGKRWKILTNEGNQLAGGDTLERAACARVLSKARVSWA